MALAKRFVIIILLFYYYIIIIILLLLLLLLFLLWGSFYQYASLSPFDVCLKYTLPLLTNCRPPSVRATFSSPRVRKP